MREENGKKQEMGALQSDNEQPQIPDQAVLASEIRPLPGQEGQRCSNLVNRKPS